MLLVCLEQALPSMFILVISIYSLHNENGLSFQSSTNIMGKAKS
jgi:hypothetical protein